MTEQAKLLQIGDVVLLDNKVSRISYVDFDTQKDVLLMKFESAEVFTDEDCEQIPLTDEILEENGFSANVFKNCMYYDYPKNTGFDELIKAHYHLIKYNSDDYYFIEDCPFINIRTVDEIQRLLRLMGFVDFANNFKV